MDPVTSVPDASGPRPLPPVPGPKLAPFTPTARADIEFIKQLGDPDVDMDAHVWKVRINGATPYYALKMVSRLGDESPERTDLATSSGSATLVICKEQQVAA